MLLKAGMNLPDGTILQYTKKGFGPESTVGRLEVEGDTRWFVSPNGGAWRIRSNSQHDWDRYELGSEGDYTLAKLHENKNKSALDLLKEYRDVVEGRIHEPAFTLLDRSDLDAFMTKRGFVKVDDHRETESNTYKSSALNLSVMIDHDDDFWTIEHVGVDEVLDDGTGENALKTSINNMIRDVKKSKPKYKNGKFNTCDECDGEGCPECHFTGKYDVGINSDHYL
jgi:hypothetical protein